jgi:hypothetical protein
VSGAPQGSLAAAIASGVENFARGEIAGCEAGIVESFDKDAQTATIRRVVTRGGVEQSTLPDIPVLFPENMATDLQEGTGGLLLTGALNWRLWWRTGEVAAPEDTAFHSVASAGFFPCLHTQGNPRSIEANSTHLLRPVAGGDVKLGTYNATKAAVHEDLMADLANFLVALDAWGSVNHGTWAVAAAAWTAGVTPLLNTLGQGAIFGSYISPSVKVED